jgi:hypothetical protein
MNAFELLKADHKKVAELFDLLETASGKRKLDVFNRIKGELELHTHIEEKIFYPAIEKPEETHDLTLEAYEEHKVVKTLLAELAGATTADDEWQAKAKVLRENVEHHVEEEENELFDKADDVLSDEEIEDLGNRMEAEKARKQGRPAPTKPEAKSPASSKASTEKPGLLSKLADFVGLGSGSAKKAAKKSAAKKAGARKPSKATAKSAAKKKAAKSASASTAKRSATAPGSKKAAARRSSSSKTGSGAGSTKKTTKKSGSAR